MDESLPLENPGNVILDNFEHELLALLHDRPAEELQHSPDVPKPVLAGKELERALSCQNCKLDAPHSSPTQAVTFPQTRSIQQAEE